MRILFYFEVPQVLLFMPRTALVLTSLRSSPKGINAVGMLRAQSSSHILGLAPVFKTKPKEEVLPLVLFYIKS